MARLAPAVERVWPLLALALLVVVVTATLGPGVDIEIWLINTILVVGLYVFVGNSGVMSFGHVSFVALGAYVGAVLTIPELTKQLVLPDLPGFLGTVELSTTAGTLAAGALALVVGYLVAIPLMRLSGLAAGIGTLALLVITNNFLLNYEPLAGSGTLTGVPTDATTGMILVWLLVAMAVAFAYQQTRSSLRLRASREDEVAARAMGVPVERDRRLAFALSAGISAIGGALYGHYLGAFGAQFFYFGTTILIIGMLVIGGQRSLTGAIVGALAISAITTWLDRWEAGESALGIALELPAGSREVLFALLVLLMLKLRPDGITGGREVPWPSRWLASRSLPARTEAGR